MHEPASSMSIWAPQPQSSEMTWPKTLESFSKVAEKQSSSSMTMTTEDMIISNEVGAIGDGRKKPSSEFDNTHVEQLLRTLNLNSPEPSPVPKTAALNLSFSDVGGSPDHSPASISSALLTPTDLSPTRPYCFNKSPYYPSDLPSARNSNEFLGQQSSLLFTDPTRQDVSHSPTFAPFPYHQTLSEQNSPAMGSLSLADSIYHHYPQQTRRDPLSQPHSAPLTRQPSFDWHISQQQAPSFQSNLPIDLQPQQQSRFPTPAEWLRSESFALGLQMGQAQAQAAAVAAAAAAAAATTNANAPPPFNAGVVGPEGSPPSQRSSYPSSQGGSGSNEPINFLSLLHPSSSPPYQSFVTRIIKSSDQQASIFLQQKLKVADMNERAKIVDAICMRGFEMMAHRFGNWAVQRCLEAAATPDEKRKIVACMRGRVVELATNCYGCHVLQKALDCEEDIRLAIVSELLRGDPAQTLVNKHASHVWSKIMELSWTPPAPPIFAFVNKSLKGKWASLACHETGSLVVQHAFENLEDSAKDGIVDELLNQGPNIFSEVAKNQWGSYCVQHILEHGSPKHRSQTLDHLINGLLEYAVSEQGAKSIIKALKEGGKDVLDRIIKKMCEPAKGARRAMIVDLALSVTGSQLIAAVLPSADKDQRAMLYDCIKGHIVTLRGCKTGSKVIWLFDRMRAYYGY